MARKRPPNKIHTSPERAGKQNLEGKVFPKDEDDLNGKILPVWEKGKENKQQYKGLWSDEEFANCIEEFFRYCWDTNLKPTQPLLQLWLGVTRVQFWNWKTKPEYGDKFNILNDALAVMESYLQGQIEKYPTGSIFLLKSSYGHAETQNVNITGSTNAEDVAEAIKKLGLDKTE